MKSYLNQSFSSVISLLHLTLFTNFGQAQVISDKTVGTIVQTPDNQTFIITEGTQVGDNIFHSFQTFSVPEQGSIVFDTSSTVQNIFSRITGENRSNINGSIVVQNSNANLFLLNPNGIFFGPNASLQLGGSFLATTAESFQFADGILFSANDISMQPLLTISSPIALNFGFASGTITNNSAIRGNSDFPIGLSVQSGKNLALVGGDIIFEGGIVTAPAGISAFSDPGGQIDIGSVDQGSVVTLNPTDTTFGLGYQQVQTFRNIQLLDRAIISSSGASNGTIRLQGRNVTVDNRSEIIGLNFGSTPGNPIIINAQELVNFTNTSRLSTNAFENGFTGNISINTKQLVLDNESLISAGANESGEQGGSITINALEQIEISNLSSLTAQTFGKGNAGNLNITTEHLILIEGGQIQTTTRDAGNGGTIFIEASESIEIIGTQARTINNTAAISLLDSSVPSGIVASTDALIIDRIATGNGGRIDISTEHLKIADGATISTEATDRSTGAAGNLFIKANEINIQSAQVSVTGTGTGAAGSIEINANSLLLDRQGQLTATTRAGEGNITLNIEDLITLQDNSTVITDAKGSAAGGNIALDTSNLVLLENSTITANAEQGRGGQVTINSPGFFSSRDSKITATSELGTEFNGDVEINVEIDVDQGLNLSTQEIIDSSTIIQTGCRGGNLPGRFLHSGSGGKAPELDLGFNTPGFWLDLRPPMSSASPEDGQNVSNSTLLQALRILSSPHLTAGPKTQTAMVDEIIEAQGWITNHQGKVVLVTRPTLTSAYKDDLTLVDCRGQAVS